MTTIETEGRPTDEIPESAGKTADCEMLTIPREDYKALINRLDEYERALNLTLGYLWGRDSERKYGFKKAEHTASFEGSCLVSSRGACQGSPWAISPIYAQVWFSVSAINLSVRGAAG